MSVMETSERRGWGEGQLDKLLEIRDGGVEKEKLKNFAKSLESHGLPPEHQMNWVTCDSSDPALQNLTKHRQFVSVYL